jgi:hypothetical protein
LENVQASTSHGIGEEKDIRLIAAELNRMRLVKSDRVGSSFATVWN